MTKIVSMNRTVYSGAWLDVVQTPGGYEFATESRMGRDHVAVLGYAGGHVLGRYEVCPAHDDPVPRLCALTGGVEDGESPEAAAMRELYEEAGFVTRPFTLRRLGAVVRPSKAMDTVFHLFAVALPVAVVDDRRYTGPGDGSDGELGAWCQLVSYELAVMSKDPLLATMAARRMVM